MSEIKIKTNWLLIVTMAVTLIGLIASSATVSLFNYGTDRLLSITIASFMGIVFFFLLNAYLKDVLSKAKNHKTVVNLVFPDESKEVWSMDKLPRKDDYVFIHSVDQNQSGVWVVDEVRYDVNLNLTDSSDVIFVFLGRQRKL